MSSIFDALHVPGECDDCGKPEGSNAERCFECFCFNEEQAQRAEEEVAKARRDVEIAIMSDPWGCGYPINFLPRWVYVGLLALAVSVIAFVGWHS